MDEFKESVRKSFTAVKQDIDYLNKENESLLGKVGTLEKANLELNNQVSDIKDELKSMAIILAKMRKELDDKPENVVRIEHKEVIREKPKQTPITDGPYEALLAFKAKANKKDMLKNKIVSMVNENGINLSELKFMFVEHYRYCSKATFYNYLKELEIERIIKLERENSKNFVYLYTMKKEV